MPKPIVASYCTTFLKPEMLHIYRQVTELQKYQTAVLTKERRCENRYPFSDVTILPKPRSNFIRRFYLKYIKGAPPIFYRGEFQVLNKALNRTGALLMHVYFGHTGVHLLPFIKVWDKPCVVSFHGADVMLREENPRYQRSLRELLATVPLVLARSHSLTDRLKEIGCPPEKLRLNRTGIPLEQFSLVERSAPAGGDWHFVQCCRLIPKKGLLTAIRAFAQLRQMYPSAVYTIAGEGPQEPELRQLIKDLQLGDSVRLVGFLSQDRLVELYGNAHVFIHPSEMTADMNQEGVPNAMLEAMATGLPVVATLHGGIPEAVEDGKSGLLVPEKTPSKLYEAMKTLVGDQEGWIAMGREASASVRREFEQKQQIARLESYYDEALSH